MKRVFIILKEDIINYPPVLTILNVLPKLGYKVIHIGVYSDIESKKKYEDEIIIGVTRLPDKKDIHNKKEKKAKTTIIPKKIIPKSKKTKEIKNTKLCNNSPTPKNK